MSRKRILILFFLVVLAALLWWWLQRPSSSSSQKTLATPTPSMQRTTSSPQPLAVTPQVTKNQAASRKEAVGKILSMLATPITFYGKVIDEKGNPVPGAEIGFSAADKFNQSGSGYTARSDEQGFFYITGIRGAALTATARKSGYYLIPKLSSQSFAYGMGPDRHHKEPPTKENPAVLVLHKMGNTEPLIYVGTRYYKLSKDGQPMEVDFATGREVPVSQGDIRFERWANDQAKNEKGKFDWRLRITVPKGGLVERQGQFDFEAAQEGYQNAVEINMPASLDEKWQYTVNKSYFIKLPDGRYARINALIQAGHNNTPLTLDSFVNPTPGSRNLEFDPKKVVKTP